MSRSIVDSHPLDLKDCTIASASLEERLQIDSPRWALDVVLPCTDFPLPISQAISPFISLLFHEFSRWDWNCRISLLSCLSDWIRLSLTQWDGVLGIESKEDSWSRTGGWRSICVRSDPTLLVFWMPMRRGEQGASVDSVNQDTKVSSQQPCLETPPLSTSPNPPFSLKVRKSLLLHSFP